MQRDRERQGERETERGRHRDRDTDRDTEIQPLLVKTRTTGILTETHLYRHNNQQRLDTKHNLKYRTKQDTGDNTQNELAN